MKNEYEKNNVNYFNMWVYSIAINSEYGLINKTFKLAFKIVNPKKDNKMLVVLSIQTFTVCIMVLLMSFYALFINHLIDENIICNYIVLVIKNFMMVYPLQVFIVGPFSRKIFRIIFKKQLLKSDL